MIKEGDREQAPHPDLGCLVEVVYQRRKVYLASWDVEVTTLVGVHLATDKVLVFPPQATPDIAAAIKAKTVTPAPVAEATPAHP